MATTKKVATEKNSTKKTTKKLPEIKVVNKKKVTFLASEAATSAKSVPLEA